jgi:hypothetical protein
VNILFKNKFRLDCFTQFSAILKVIGGSPEFINFEPAMTLRDEAAYLNAEEKTTYRLVTKGGLSGLKVLG